MSDRFHWSLVIILREDILANDVKLLTMSVPKSMQRMVTVPSGSGISQRMNARKGEISGMLDVKV